MPQIGGFAHAVALAVADALSAAGVSGNELARHLDRAQSYASVRINGRKPWSMEELDVIARLVGVSTFDLVERARNIR